MADVWGGNWLGEAVFVSWVGGENSWLEVVVDEIATVVVGFEPVVEEDLVEV